MIESPEKYRQLAAAGTPASELYVIMRSDGIGKLDAFQLLRRQYSLDLAECTSIERTAPDAAGFVDCVVVPPDQFLEMLLSRRGLERADSLGGRVRGLFDPDAGRQFLIEDANLMPRPKKDGESR
jgi:hypothetical protein